MSDFEKTVLDELKSIKGDLKEHMARTEILERRSDWLHKESDANSLLLNRKIDSDLKDLKNQVGIAQWLLPIIVTVILFMLALGFK